MDVACARFTTFLKGENLHGYPERYIGVPNRHAMEFVALVLKGTGLASGAVRGRDGCPFLHCSLLPGAL